MTTVTAGASIASIPGSSSHVAEVSQTPELTSQYAQHYYQFGASLPRTESQPQAQVQSPTQIQTPAEQSPDDSSGKRKQPDDPTAQSSSTGKRRRARDEEWDHDDPDLGPNGGPKHWTDQEKSSLFTWILCHDAHWDAFNTKMNTVFRDTSVQIFSGRKSFTALKSCFHRNLDVFKQIFAFEAFLARSAASAGDALTAPHFDSASERQAFLEERLEAARAAGALVGNLNVKVIDHWYANGWYLQFKQRYQEDRKTGLPVPMYAVGRPAAPDAQASIDPSLTAGALAHSLPSLIPPPLNIRVAPPPQPQQHALTPPVPYAAAAPQASTSQLSSQSQSASAPAWQEPRRPPLPAAPIVQTLQSTLPQHHAPPRPQTSSNDAVVAALERLTATTQTLVETCTELGASIRAQQNADGKQEGFNVKEKAALAMEMLGNEDMSAEVKAAAAEYLKRLFTGE